MQYIPTPSWFLHCRGIGDSRPELSGEPGASPGSRAITDNVTLRKRVERSHQVSWVSIPAVYHFALVTYQDIIEAWLITKSRIV